MDQRRLSLVATRLRHCRRHGSVWIRKGCIAENFLRWKIKRNVRENLTMRGSPVLCISTSFWVLCVTKSWSKYTTHQWSKAQHWRLRIEKSAVWILLRPKIIIFQNFSFPLFTTAGISIFLATNQDFIILDLNVQLKLITVEHLLDCHEETWKEPVEIDQERKMFFLR